MNGTHIDPAELPPPVTARPGAMGEVYLITTTSLADPAEMVAREKFGPGNGGSSDPERVKNAGGTMGTPVVLHRVDVPSHAACRWGA